MFKKGTESLRDKCPPFFSNVVIEKEAILARVSQRNVQMAKSSIKVTDLPSVFNKQQVSKIKKEIVPEGLPCGLVSSTSHVLNGTVNWKDV